MSDYKGVFDWVQFPEGRARFSGGVRGIVDEERHETFAIEVANIEYFGEIEAIYLQNQNDYNIRVISFGYGSDKYVGMSMLGTCRIFTATELIIIQSLVVQLIAAGMRFEDRPSLLMEFLNAHFMREVIFKGGWVLVREEIAA